MSKLRTHKLAVGLVLSTAVSTALTACLPPESNNDTSTISDQSVEQLTHNGQRWTEQSVEQNDEQQHAKNSNNSHERGAFEDLSEQSQLPGAAKIGADGHYDYSSPDFVLRDPCEDSELLNRLSAAGWEFHDSPISRVSRSDTLGCTLTPNDYTQEGFSLVALSYNASDFAQDSTLYGMDSTSNPPKFMAIPPTQFGELCIVASETPQGAIGLAYSFSQVSLYNTHADACNFISNQFDTIFGGK